MEKKSRTEIGVFRLYGFGYEVRFFLCLTTFYLEFPCYEMVVIVVAVVAVIVCMVVTIQNYIFIARPHPYLIGFLPVFAMRIDVQCVTAI